MRGQLILDRARWLMGWMTEDELSYLAEIANGLKDYSTIFEIGSFCGRSARVLADNSPRNCRIYCIDPWDYNIPMFDAFGNSIDPIVVDDSTLHQFCLNLDEYVLNRKVVPIKSKWEDFYIPVKADFIFIDGDHGYEVVKNDILKALRHLKPNGILAGHDYLNFEEVRMAVNELFQKTDIEVRETIWCTRKF